MTIKLNYQADLYVPSDRTVVDQAFFNERFSALYNQLLDHDNTISGYGDAEQTLVQLGLTRLNEVMQPLLLTLQDAANLGFLVCQAVGGPGVSLALGAPVSFTITDGGDLFTPTYYLLAQDQNNFNNWGLLTVDAGGFTKAPDDVTPTTLALRTHSTSISLLSATR